LFDSLCTKQFQRAASDEGFGDRLAEIGRGGDDRSALYDVRYLIAVGRDDHGVQVVDLVNGMAVCAEGELTASTEGGEDGALGGDGVLGVGAVEGADGGVDRGVAGGVFRVERMLRAADL
jgi:hypothetical protein